MTRHSFAAISPLNKMAHIESTIRVDRSLEHVFDFLNSAQNHGRFIPNMTEFKQTTPGMFGKVGATAQGILSYFRLLRIKVQYEIIEYELNHRLAMNGKMGPIRFKDGYVLKKEDNGTEIQFWLDLAPVGWTKLFAPFMGLIGKVHAWETLRNLKREIQKIGG